MRQRLEKKGKKRKADDDDDNLIAELEDIAASSSERERKASDLERAVSQLHACWLMKDRVGEVHPGIVTGVSEAGAFVRLEDLFVEGLVRMQDLGNEYFSFDEEALTLRGERSRDVISFGVRFEVELLAVDLTRRQMSFLRAGPLVKPAAAAAAAAAAAPSGGKQASGWEPRTDARPGQQRPDKRRSPSRGSPSSSSSSPAPSGGKPPAAKRGRRQERADDQRPPQKAIEPPVADPRGRGRGEKQRNRAFEAAKRHVRRAQPRPRSASSSRSAARRSTATN